MESIWGNSVERKLRCLWTIKAVENGVNEAYSDLTRTDSRRKDFARGSGFCEDFLRVNYCLWHAGCTADTPAMM